MHKIGKQTVCFDNPPIILETASIVGPKEANGPMASYFDKCLEDEFWGEKSWEKAESKIIKETVNLAVSKSGLANTDIDYCFAGDLLNQCISSDFGLRDTNVPFFGVFGACSTFVESMCLGSVFIEGGAANNVICATSSHFCSAEKQFRFPLELGTQRPPTAQWTVTGSGAIVVGNTGESPCISAITVGKIIDMGIKDANNMGAAMAPAAAATITNFLKDTKSNPNDYDLILTGDLGTVGSKLLIELLQKDNIDIKNKHSDCGVMIYDIKNQDVHAGGSGCGCSASVLCSVILNQLKNGELSNVLFVATGALMSPTSSQQGESIPGIAHLVHLKSCSGKLN